MALTKTQRDLFRDIRSIEERSAQNHWDIESFSPESRTQYLLSMKRQLIIGEVVKTYTFIDELLSVIICHAYFRKPKSQMSFQKLWRTKKFSAFAYHVLDNLYPLQKTKLVHELRSIPKSHRDTIDRLNALRNALSHSFFPENRKVYKAHKAVVYQGKD